MTEDAVIAEGLVKRFGDVVALNGVDLRIPAGTIFGLLGPNGAGKTTAVRVLSTVLRPDAGRAEVLGRDVVREADAVRRRIGLAGQFAAVDANLTGRENLRLIGKLAQLPSPAIMPRADELLDRFELTEAATRPVRTYSGGMRRRLDVAASLMRRPPVLFLDEPTTGLDLHSRGELWDMIRELVAEGTTVLLTTQYLEEADRLAERVAVVDRGQVIANDTPAHLKSQLGGTVIELGFGDEAAAARAMPEVAAAAGDDGRVELEERKVRITTPDGARLLMGVLRHLDANDLEPANLAVREPSLDDVFLSLTGHHAEDAPTEQKAKARRRGAA
ncbi:MAG: ATP-binding cassette domain-containing protein [Actinobacteria bacterium]|nr:ATP-binding cassette domain-containing protein [Actinomycetota bacterium]